MPLTRRARGLLVVCALGVVAAACSSGSGGTKATTTTTSRRSSTTSTVASTSSTSPTSSSSTSTTIARQGAASPADAAQRLYDDWQAGRHADTSDYATQQAKDQLFGYSPAGGAAFQGCGETEPGVATCSWRYEGGGVVMQVSRNDTNGWLVESASIVVD